MIEFQRPSGASRTLTTAASAQPIWGTLLAATIALLRALRANGYHTLRKSDSKERRVPAIGAKWSHS